MTTEPPGDVSGQPPGTPVYAPGWGGPYAPAPRRRRGVSLAGKVGIAVAVLAGIAVVVVIIGAVVNVAGDNRHLSAPASVAGVPRIDDPRFAQLEQRVTQSIAGTGAHHAVVAFYGDGGRPAFLLAGADASAFADPNRAVDELLSGFTAGASAARIGPATAYPAGSRGGRVKCGTFTDGAVSGTYCGFSDHSVAGIVLSFDLTNPQDTADLTSRVRAAAEH